MGSNIYQEFDLDSDDLLMLNIIDQEYTKIENQRIQQKSKGANSSNIINKR
jgi:hypothetical protein